MTIGLPPMSQGSAAVVAKEVDFPLSPSDGLKGGQGSKKKPLFKSLDMFCDRTATEIKVAMLLGNGSGSTHVVRCLGGLYKMKTDNVLTCVIIMERCSCTLGDWLLKHRNLSVS